MDIVYGNSNYHLSGSGMSSTDAWYAGYHQSQTAQDLAGYQASKGYDSQTADAASDMEPSWDGVSITKQLVNGDAAQGWALYYDFGSADGCPQSGSADGPCNNGWHASDVGYVSDHGLALPLPEIYYTANANQWTVVRKWWTANQSRLLLRRGDRLDRRRADAGSRVEHPRLAQQRPRRSGARVLRLLTVAACALVVGGGFAIPRLGLAPSAPPGKAAALQRLGSVATTDSNTEPVVPPDAAVRPIPPGCSVPTRPSRSRRPSSGCGTGG